MAILPATGSEIAMGKVQAAYTDPPPQTYPLPANSNIRLSATLGSHLGLTAGTQIKFSATFGGKTTPYDYPT